MLLKKRFIGAVALMITVINLQAMSKVALRNQLHQAVLTKNAQAIKAAILAGANPNIPAGNPLVYALSTNDYDLAQFLLEHNAKLTQRLGRDFIVKGHPYLTVLDFAISKMDQHRLSPEMVQLLGFGHA